MSLFFRPSVPLFYEFVLGRTEPYRAYLICGPEASGFCLGTFDITLRIPKKQVTPITRLPEKLFTAVHAFDCLSFYSYAGPKIQVACAETRLIKAGEEFKLDMLSPHEIAPYEQDLQKVISA